MAKTLFVSLEGVVVKAGLDCLARNLLKTFPGAFANKNPAALHGLLCTEPAEALFKRFQLGAIGIGGLIDGFVDVLRVVLTRQGSSILRSDHTTFARAYREIYTPNQVVVRLLQDRWEEARDAFKLYALADSDECRWPEIWALTGLPFLGGVFSHELKTLKPAEKFYLTAKSLADNPPEACFYIDSDLNGILAGRGVGFQSHHYDPKDPERDARLRHELETFLK